MAIAFVQKNGQLSAGAATTHNVPISAAPAANAHLLLVIITAGNRTFTVTDTKSNTWAERSRRNSGSSLTLAVWECWNTGGLTTSDTVDVVISGSQGLGALIFEWSGGDAGGWFDVEASADSGGVGVTAFDTGLTGATAQADELWFGVLGMTATSAGITFSQEPATALDTITPTDFVRTAYPYYKVLSATGQQQFDGTYTTARQNVSSVTAWKAAAGGGGGPGGVEVRLPAGVM